MPTSTVNQPKTIYQQDFGWIKHSLSWQRDFYQALLSQVSNRICFTNLINRRVLKARPALQRLLSYTNRELLNLTLFAIATRQTRSYQLHQTHTEPLEHLNRLKETFLSAVSHELRTPITTIKMAIQMLTLALGREGLLVSDSKPSLSANKVAHYLKILNEECNREIGLITDLLDLQQLEAGTRVINAQPIHLPSYLSRIVRPFENYAYNQQQLLQIEVTPELPYLLSDSQSLERILVELLTNACKYTPFGETITVKADVSGRADLSSQTILISVNNSGVEIPADQIGRIFDKFYRVPNGDPHKHGGTGLGLALVKKLVLHLGGSVYAESQNGQTRFTVELPLKLTAATNPLASAAVPVG